MYCVSTKLLIVGLKKSCNIPQVLTTNIKTLNLCEAIVSDHDLKWWDNLKLWLNNVQWPIALSTVHLVCFQTVVCVLMLCKSDNCLQLNVRPIILMILREISNAMPKNNFLSFSVCRPYIPNVDSWLPYVYPWILSCQNSILCLERLQRIFIWRYTRLWLTISSEDCDEEESPLFLF